MQVKCIPPNQLTDRQIHEWLSILDAQPEYSSPFFRPEYFQLMSQFRPSTELLIGTDDDALQAVLAIDRQGRQRAAPAGIKLCDFQGVVARAGCGVDAQQLLQAAGLKRWRFDHLIDDGSTEARCRFRSSPSPYLDLEQGYEAYRATRRELGGGRIVQTERKRRKLEREQGEIRFEWHSCSEQLLNQMMEWKSEQRRETGTFDVLSLDWVRQFARELQQSENPDFGGVLSVLHVGQRVAAIHFGLRSPRRLHYWFPTYDFELARYSPGSILLLEMAQAASERGIGRLDLGKGDDPYKSSFATGSEPVWEGLVTVNPWQHALAVGGFQFKQWARSTQLKALLSGPRRWWRSLHSQHAMS